MPAFSLQLAGARALRSASRAVRPDELGALKPLLGAMQRVLNKKKAQGICAPQLGSPVRLFMLARDEEQPPLVAINPRILRRSRERYTDWESCLSVPDHAALVSRPKKISVEYSTLEGETVQKVLSGNRARVFQHEFDHLDAVLYTERMIDSSFSHLSLLRDPTRMKEIEQTAIDTPDPESTVVE